ncbi:MAG: hypothetical protein A2350_11500 [Candidatus Raymondbacteria bacterium RifOxyB12_full_50_8]|uniref:Uncharacterized protein n=1 Tax=Candidatus Raymondbacteria bacterium RIFOXYD12_FULL_49_13 TaxID=1817890 RepID=A0A1F7FGA1_UNCRA|nr:MAG: hypothetical protein A2350_11500 [Candidatus Raymondbacteria bacterium RifOxyB12_full_50_8]OGK05621.1 MAG: hypothetical protein A2519_01890 [Candidatus Raymondbacteria bacterium RIFOXYD12_FULL_49_13]
MSTSLTFEPQTKSFGKKVEYFLNETDGSVDSFIITAADGIQYKYGIPVYNNTQTTISGGNSYDWSANDNTRYMQKDDFIYTAWTHIKKPFAYSWLLTEIRYPNFVDPDNNGADDGDFGEWVRFRYHKTCSKFHWRNPYRRIPGMPSKYINPTLTYANQFGDKEIVYLNSVETSTHKAVFAKSPRKDGYGYYMDDVGENVNVSIKKFMNAYRTGKNLVVPNFYRYDEDEKDGVLTTKAFQGHQSQETVLKLDKIYLFAKSADGSIDGTLPNVLPEAGTPFDANYYASGSAYSNFVKEVELKYDYLLCPGTHNSNSNSNDRVGDPDDRKLTLTQLVTKGRNGLSVLPPYEFYYITPDMPYDPRFADRWGYYKKKNGFGGKTTSFCENMVNAWSMDRIVLPSGGVIAVDYESDDYYKVHDQEIILSKNSRHYYFVGEKEVSNSLEIGDGWAVEPERLTGLATVCPCDFPDITKEGKFSWTGLKVQFATQINDLYIPNGHASNFLEFDVTLKKGQAVIAQSPRDECFAKGDNPKWDEVEFTGIDFSQEDFQDLYVVEIRHYLKCDDNEPGEDYTFQMTVPRIRIFVSGQKSGENETSDNIFVVGHKGGGLRVKKIDMADGFGNHYITAYNYNTPGSYHSSGYTSSLPPSQSVLDDADAYLLGPIDGTTAGIDIMNDPLQWTSARHPAYDRGSLLPGPGVMYQYVTVTQLVGGALPDKIVTDDDTEGGEVPVAEAEIGRTIFQFLSPSNASIVGKLNELSANRTIFYGKNNGFFSEADDNTCDNTGNISYYDANSTANSTNTLGSYFGRDYASMYGAPLSIQILNSAGNTVKQVEHLYYPLESPTPMLERDKSTGSILLKCDANAGHIEELYGFNFYNFTRRDPSFAITDDLCDDETNGTFDLKESKYDIEHLARNINYIRHYSLIPQGVRTTENGVTTVNVNDGFDARTGLPIFTHVEIPNENATNPDTVYSFKMPAYWYYVGMESANMLTQEYRQDIYEHLDFYDADDGNNKIYGMPILPYSTTDVAAAMEEKLRYAKVTTWQTAGPDIDYSGYAGQAKTINDGRFYSGASYEWNAVLDVDGKATESYIDFALLFYDGRPETPVDGTGWHYLGGPVSDYSAASPIAQGAYNHVGKLLNWEDGNRIKSNAYFIHGQSLIEGIVNNANIHESGFLTFEQELIVDKFMYDPEFHNVWDKVGAVEFSTVCAHTGIASALYQGTRDGAIVSHFAKIDPAKDYVFSFWITNKGLDCDEDFVITVNAETCPDEDQTCTQTGTEIVKRVVGKDEGSVRTRWMPVEVFISGAVLAANGSFSDPENATACLHVSLASGSQYYVDDIRMGPASAQITTYTWDKQSKQVLTITDPNRNTTYYQYDAAGRLTAIKNNAQETIKAYTYHIAQGK